MFTLLLYVYVRSVGRDGSVGIATRDGLDGPRIESRWKRDFLYPSRPELGPHSHSYAMGAEYVAGMKRSGIGFDSPPQSSVEVKGKVRLYLYSTSGPVLGVNLSVRNSPVGCFHQRWCLRWKRSGSTDPATSHSSTRQLVLPSVRCARSR